MPASPSSRVHQARLLQSVGAARCALMKSRRCRRLAQRAWGVGKPRTSLLRGPISMLAR